MASNGEQTSMDLQDSIPIIDYFLLTLGTVDDRSKVVHDLGKACQDWGCFMLVNHGIPEAVIHEMMNASNDFFNMTKEEKVEFAANGVLDPIRCSTGFNPAHKHKDSLWREYLRLIVHPEFHCPHKPPGFSWLFMEREKQMINHLLPEEIEKFWKRLYYDHVTLGIQSTKSSPPLTLKISLNSELASDYVKRTRTVAMELIKGVSESLGFEESYMNEELNFDSGFQLLAINYYPSLAEFDTPRGLMPHTDHGLLTLLYENGVPGLEVLRNGKWVGMSDVPNAFSVLNSDHLEVFSNGKYKSKLHRTVVKDERKRITLVNPNGPSLDTVVGPSSRLVDGGNSLPGYLPMRYSEYLEMQTKLTMAGKHAFDIVRFHI